MKVIIIGPDTICTREMDQFKAAGVEVLRCPPNDWETLGKLTHEGASVVMLYGTHLPTEAIEKFSDSVKCIITMFIGYNAIDVKLATERGIMVCNNPNYGTEEVAAMAMSMFMALNRKLQYYNPSMHAGDWSKGPYNHFHPYVGHRLSSMTLGVVGFGNIARNSARMGLGLGMKVVAYDPFVPEEKFTAMGVKKVELDELFAVADAITVHVPLFDSTYHLINADSIAKMKDGVLIINTARGPLVDEKALEEALKSGKVAAAGLDVFDIEPIPADHPFLKMDNVILAPHAAWHTLESFQDVDRLAAEIAITAAKGGVPFSCVNKKALGLA